MSPEEFLAGWKPEQAQVFVNGIAEAEIGKELAARIQIAGQGARATVIGTVSLLRRVGRPKLPPGVEIKLDVRSIPAVQFLARVSRGEPFAFRERSPRYALERKLKLKRDEVEVEVTTVNVSEGGCFVHWQGTLPLVGETIGIRLGDSIL